MILKHHISFEEKNIKNIPNIFLTKKGIRITKIHRKFDGYNRKERIGLEVFTTTKCKQIVKIKPAVQTKVIVCKSKLTLEKKEGSALIHGLECLSLDNVNKIKKREIESDELPNENNRTNAKRFKSV